MHYYTHAVDIEPAEITQPNPNPRPNPNPNPNHYICKFTKLMLHNILTSYVCTQGVDNRLRLTWIVGVACFLHHQLAAVLDASFSVSG